MARYVFSITANGNCVAYCESTVEEDKMDAGLVAMGGSGYLSFWKRCKQVVTDLRSLVRTAKGMETLSFILPDMEWLANVDDIEAVITDLYYAEERSI